MKTKSFYFVVLCVMMLSFVTTGNAQNPQSQTVNINVPGTVNNGQQFPYYIVKPLNNLADNSPYNINVYQKINNYGGYGRKNTLPAAQKVVADTAKKVMPEKYSSDISRFQKSLEEISTLSHFLTDSYKKEEVKNSEQDNRLAEMQYQLDLQNYKFHKALGITGLSVGIVSYGTAIYFAARPAGTETIINMIPVEKKVEIDDWEPYLIENTVGSAEPVKQDSKSLSGIYSGKDAAMKNSVFTENGRTGCAPQPGHPRWKWNGGDGHHQSDDGQQTTTTTTTDNDNTNNGTVTGTNTNSNNNSNTGTNTSTNTNIGGSTTSTNTNTTTSTGGNVGDVTANGGNSTANGGTATATTGTITNTANGGTATGGNSTSTSTATTGTITNTNTANGGSVGDINVTVGGTTVTVGGTTVTVPVTINMPTKTYTLGYRPVKRTGTVTVLEPKPETVKKSKSGDYTASLIFAIVGTGATILGINQLDKAGDVKLVLYQDLMGLKNGGSFMSTARIGVSVKFGGDPNKRNRHRMQNYLALNNN
jgi:hypothetical protein